MTGPFCTSHSICLNIGFWESSFVWICYAFNCSAFNAKRVSIFLKKRFSFQTCQVSCIWWMPPVTQISSTHASVDVSSGLRALLNDETSTFNDMLSKSNDTTIHVKTIQKLMLEFYKYLYGLSAPIMKEVFKKEYFSITFEIVEKLFCQNLKPKNMALIR